MSIFNIFRRGEEVTASKTLLAALGQKTTVGMAINIPALAASVDWIAQKVAELPIKLYRDNNGEAEEITRDDRIKWLNDACDADTMTAVEAKESMVRDYLLSGSGYMFIDWDMNAVRGLHYVRTSDVSYSAPTDPIHRTTVYYINDAEYRPYQLIRLLRHTRDGVSGTGIPDENAEIINAAYQMIVFQKMITQSGGCRKAIFQADKKLSPEAYTELKAAVEKFYSTAGTATVALNAGVTAKELSATPTEMQLNENIITLSEQIYQLFGLSASVVNGTATDEQIAHAVQSAVIPLTTKIETQLNKSLLLESEKASMYFAFDLKELLKGDIQKRYAAYKTALESNFMQINEVRYAEDLPPIDFDYLKFNLSDVFYDQKKNEFYIPNTNATNKTKGGDNNGL